MKQLPKPTLAQVAQLCGVSPRLVSAVISGRDGGGRIGCKGETRKRIQDAARRLGYRLHRGASCMRDGRHGMIGVLTSNFYAIPWQAIEAMLRATRKAGQILSFDYLIGGEVPPLLSEDVVDGLLVYEPLPQEIEQAIGRYHVPIVRVNAGNYGQPNSVHYDDAGAVEQVVYYWASRGRKRIGMVFVGDEGPIAKAWETALVAAAKRKGMIRPRTAFLDKSVDTVAAHQWTEFLSPLLQDGDAVDAIILPDPTAVSAMLAVARSRRLRIPRDLAIVCLQDSRLLENATPPVAGLNIDRRASARLGVTMLNELIGKPAKTIPPIMMSYQLNVRESMG